MEEIIKNNKNNNYKRHTNDLKIVNKRLSLSGIKEKFRSKWNLPLDGFKHDITFDDWFNKYIIAQSNKWRNSKECKLIKSKRKKFKIKELKEDRSYRKELDKLRWELIDKDKYFFFMFDINKVLNHLKIPDRFRYFVMQSMVFNKPVETEVKRDKPIPIIKHNPNTLTNELHLKIFDHTTRTELISKELWTKINRFKKRLYDHKSISNKISTTFDRNMKLFEWHHKDGLSYTEVRKKAKKELKLNIKSNEELGVMLNRLRKK